MPERTSWLAARDDLEDGQRYGRRAVLLEAPQDVLDADHRVVDQLADGNREAAQASSVLIVRPKALKTSTVTRIEIGNGGERNQGRAHIHQKQEQDDGDDHARLPAEHAFDVVDRSLDEGRLPKLNVRSR